MGWEWFGIILVPVLASAGVVAWRRRARRGGHPRDRDDGADGVAPATAASTTGGRDRPDDRDPDADGGNGDGGGGSDGGGGWDGGGSDGSGGGSE